jgi:hypothetical protein
MNQVAPETLRAAQIDFGIQSCQITVGRFFRTPFGEERTTHVSLKCPLDEEKPARKAKNWLPNWHQLASNWHELG